jgi:hypothetical protein
MSNGRTPRFGSYIDNILVSKASIKLTELIFDGVLAPKPRFSQKGRRNLFSRNPLYAQPKPYLKAYFNSTNISIHDSTNY